MPHRQRQKERKNSVDSKEVVSSRKDEEEDVLQTLQQIFTPQPMGDPMPQQRKV